MYEGWVRSRDRSIDPYLEIEYLSIDPYLKQIDRGRGRGIKESRGEKKTATTSYKAKQQWPQ